MDNVKPPKRLQPGESLDDAVYCAECANLEQKIIGDAIGKCFGFTIKNTRVPLKCPHFKNDPSVISLLIFLKSGISVYHKAIVKDVTTQVDPELLSSFLRAISAFGEELTKEEVSLIKFQQINIIFCKGQYSNGAILIRGKVKDEYKEYFSLFLKNVETQYKDYFLGEYTGRCLPQVEIDQICYKSLNQFIKQKFHQIPDEIIEKYCGLTCGIWEPCGSSANK